MDDSSIVERAEISISRGSDREEECILTTDHNQILEEMSASCMAIYLLGRLMQVAPKKDVSLAANPPQGGFVHIKFPDSLKASLVQLSNDGHDAFQTAHMNMDKIRLLTEEIPKFLHEVINASLSGTDQDVEMTTKDTLNKLGKRANKCAQLAHGTRESFQRVMYEIQELLAAATATSTYTEQQVRENEELFAELQAQRTSEEEAREQNRQVRDDIKKEVEKVRRLYEEALENTTWETLALGLAQEAIQTINTYMLFSEVIPAFGKIGSDALRCYKESCHDAPISRAERGENTLQEMKSETIFAVKYSLKMIPAILACFNISAVGEISFVMPKRGITGFENEFKNLLMEIGQAGGRDRISRSIANTMRVAAQRCEEIRTIVKANYLEGASDKLKPIMDELNELLDEVKSLDMMLNIVVNQNPTPSRIPQPPAAAAAPPPPTEMSILAVISENTHVRIQSAQETLKMYEEKNLEAEKRFQESHIKLHKIVAELRCIDLTKTDLESVRATLKKGLFALAQVSKTWSKLVVFFTKVANMVDTKFCEGIIGFEEKAQNALKSQSAYSRGLMYDYARAATQSTIAVHSLSTMYVQVAERFILPQLVTLPELMFTENQREGEDLANRLEIECNTNMERIGMMAEEKREDYQRKIRDRLSRLEEARKSLPPLPAETVVRNERAIKRAINSVEDF